MSSRSRAAVVAACLALAGCSFLGVKHPIPSQGHAVPPRPCTRSYALPLVDTAATLALLVASALTFERVEDACEQDGICDPQSPIAGMFPLLGAVPFAVAAGYGLGGVSGCRRTEAATASRRRG